MPETGVEGGTAAHTDEMPVAEAMDHVEDEVPLDPLQGTAGAADVPAEGSLVAQAALDHGIARHGPRKGLVAEGEG